MRHKSMGNVSVGCGFNTGTVIRMNEYLDPGKDSSAPDHQVNVPTAPLFNLTRKLLPS